MSGYLRFNRTGNEKFDAVLSAIENAGHSFHHTSQWSEPIDYREDGKSCDDLIEEAIEACRIAETQRQTCCEAYHQAKLADEFKIRARSTVAIYGALKAPTWLS